MQSIRRIFTPVDGNVLRFTFFFWAEVEDKLSERDSDCTVHRPEHTNMHTEFLYNKTLWKKCSHLVLFSLIVLLSCFFLHIFQAEGCRHPSLSPPHPPLSLSPSHAALFLASLARSVAHTVILTPRSPTPPLSHSHAHTHTHTHTLCFVIIHVSCYSGVHAHTHTQGVQWYLFLQREAE